MMDHQILDAFSASASIRGYNNTFARRQPVSLDNHWRVSRTKRSPLLRHSIASSGELQRPDMPQSVSVPRHEVLCKDLASLESCRRAVGPTIRSPRRVKQVHDACCERRFRTHKSEINLFRLYKLASSA
jgi:hypothetical protein